MMMMMIVMNDKDIHSKNVVGVHQQEAKKVCKGIDMKSEKIGVIREFSF